MDTEPERERERLTDKEGQVHIVISCLESSTVHFGSNNFGFGWVFILVEKLFVKKNNFDKNLCEQKFEKSFF